MKFVELMEGATPKLPGAVRGIQVMTPQQFVAKSGDEEVDEDLTRRGFLRGLGAAGALGIAGAAHSRVSGDTTDDPDINRLTGKPKDSQSSPEPQSNAQMPNKDLEFAQKVQRSDNGIIITHDGKEYEGIQVPQDAPVPRGATAIKVAQAQLGIRGIGNYKTYLLPNGKAYIYSLRGTNEATKLPASTRELKGKELEDYLDRIRGQEKEKTDKYKLPYIHRSSVIKYYNEAGKRYDTDAIKDALKERPKALLKKNEKMKHSDGEQEQFFNIGFAALVGIALDEQTNELIVVNTCPGAGSCKVDCFAMKGGKIQFQGPWLSDGRILTYLLNDPSGFFGQLKSEIQREEQKGQKGGYKVSIRWHDAGDFFSPEYAELAFKLASELPNVQFYAYTKVADVALGDKPDNFMINWSEGASTSQEKKVKAADPNLERTKNSRIVPTNLFYDLLVKDEKKNLVKGPEGQWQVIPDKLPELKQRLAKQYNLTPNSILSYNEWDSKTQGGKKETPVKYNVIITPGEPDITAKSSGVLSTLLLKH